MKIGRASSILKVIAICLSVVSHAGADDSCTGFSEPGFCEALDVKGFKGFLDLWDIDIDLELDIPNIDVPNFNFLPGVDLNFPGIHFDLGNFMNLSIDFFLKPFFLTFMYIWWEYNKNTGAPPGACLLDFPASDFQTEQDLLDRKCDLLPLDSDGNYGTLAAQLDITRTMQNFLIATTGGSLWTQNKGKTVKPNFCMAFRFPTSSCSNFYMGITLNSDAIVTLGEITPAGQPFDSIIAAFTAITAVGVNQMTFAWSTGGDMDTEAKVYDGGWDYRTQPFYSNMQYTMTGKIDIPGIPREVKNFLSVTGDCTRAVDLGETIDTIYDAVDGIFSGFSRDGLDSKSPEQLAVMAGDFVAKMLFYPELIVTKGQLTIKLYDNTRGLLPDLRFGSAETQMLKVPYNSNGFEQGIYLFTQTKSGLLKDMAGTLCDNIEGAMKAVAAAACPAMDTFSNTLDATLGFYVQPDEKRVGLLIKWSGFKVKCTAKSVFTSNTSLECNIDNVIFEVIADAAGFVIKKIGDGIETVAKVGTEVVDQLGGPMKKAAIGAVFSSKDIAENMVDDVAEYFGGGTDHESLSYGFKDKYKCEGSKPMLFTSQSSKIDDYDDHFNTLGMDDSRASCFTACYMYAKKKNWQNENQLCCEYERIGSGSSGYRECKIGKWGRKSNNKQKNSVTMTFMDDFDNMGTLKPVGESCSNGRDCLTGHCGHMVEGKRCINQCHKDRNKCFPSNFQKCDRHDECMDINNLIHECKPRGDGANYNICKATNKRKKTDPEQLVEDLLGPDHGYNILAAHWEGLPPFCPKSKDGCSDSDFVKLGVDPYGPDSSRCASGVKRLCALLAD